MRLARLSPLALIVVAAALLGAVVTGCGSENPTEQLGPRGNLTADRIGPVQQGMTTGEVHHLFGRPDETDRASGCEFNPSAGPTLTWTWLIQDGSLQLSFDGVHGRLSSYRINSPKLSTTLGNRVRNSFHSLRLSWGQSLKPLSLGTASTSKEGYWYVGDPESNELLFDIRGGAIDSISGGYLPPCE